MTRATARFDDLPGNTALVFDAPHEIVTATDPAGVVAALRRVETAAAAGRWAYGFVAYEAAAGLAPASAVPPAVRARPVDSSPVPLVWFGIGAPPRREAAITSTTALTSSPSAVDGGGFWAAPWKPAWDSERHAGAVRELQAAIAAGEVYQANLTVRLHGRVVGDEVAFYADLARAQHARYCSYLDFGPGVVLSASPELFLEWAPPMLRTRPMKGTAARGRTPQEDERLRAGLRASSKDAAENVMIVDLVRNDLGRVARTGTVRVSDLLRVEAYPTVWQLTSGIECETRPEVGLAELFAAIFPCGSVTGAPKLAAMRHIAALEDEPRSVYCGAIGWVAPPGEAVRARFAVAIRTVLLDRASGDAGYGAGGGITICSDAAAEFAELLAKTVVLPVGEALQLLETFALVNGTARNLDLHLRRLAASARVFGFHYDDTAVRVAVLAAVADADGDARVGLRLSADGTLQLRLGPLPAVGPQPVRLALDTVALASASPFLAHKTSRRGHYDAARARHRDVDDVVLINDRGEVSETTVASLAVLVDGTWWTPPLASGCLPGIARGLALQRGELTERRLTPAELRAADDLAVLSSLRGRRAAVLVTGERPHP